jgi:hypothetical protein
VYQSKRDTQANGPAPRFNARSYADWLHGLFKVARGLRQEVALIEIGLGDEEKAGR